jgi:hypothetical protein
LTQPPGFGQALRWARDPEAARALGTNKIGIQELSARVGVPFKTGNLHFACSGPPESTTGLNVELVAGSLPPGLKFEPGPIFPDAKRFKLSEIVGAPTRAGDWYITLKFPKADWEPDCPAGGDVFLILKITATGSSAPGSLK